MGLQTDMYPSHGFKQQQQSYYNDNDYYSSEDNHYSNNGSSMQMKKPHGYPTPLPTQNHRMMMSHGGYSHDEDSWYNKDKFQTSNGHYNSNSQYGHMSHDSANISSYGLGMQHSGGYGSGTHHSSHANGGYGSAMQHMNGGYGNGMQHASHMSGGYGTGMQHSSHMNGGYGSGMHHSSHMNGGYGGGMQQSSHSHMSRGLENDPDRSPGYYEQHNNNTHMWNMKSLND